ncbi:hypothetical protein JYT83_01345 [bacterium AH-315-F18]|nr:hypothetical protein [bacterium AH-315-F18]
MICIGLVTVNRLGYVGLVYHWSNDPLLSPVAVKGLQDGGIVLLVDGRRIRPAWNWKPSYQKMMKTWVLDPNRNRIDVEPTGRVFGDGVIEANIYVAWPESIGCGTCDPCARPYPVKIPLIACKHPEKRLLLQKGFVQPEEEWLREVEEEERLLQVEAEKVPKKK